jgi:hypothetical protein
MNIEDKIYALGLAAFDELLLHRNITKKVELSLVDSKGLNDWYVNVGTSALFAFSEAEIAAFYRVWTKEHKGVISLC